MCDGTRSCGYGGSLMVAAIMDTVGDTMGLMELVLIVDIYMMEYEGDANGRYVGCQIRGRLVFILWKPYGRNNVSTPPTCRFQHKVRIYDRLRESKQ